MDSSCGLPLLTALTPPYQNECEKCLHFVELKQKPLKQATDNTDTSRVVAELLPMHY